MVMLMNINRFFRELGAQPSLPHYIVSVFLAFLIHIKDKNNHSLIL